MSQSRLTGSESRMEEPSPVIPLVSDNLHTFTESELPEGISAVSRTKHRRDSEEEEEEEVPGTPPAKKVNYISTLSVLDYKQKYISSL